MMNTYMGHECSSVQNDDLIPLLMASTANPLDKENVLIRNDLSQIKTLHNTFKKKNRRSKSEYHDRMKHLLEYDTTKLVYTLSTILFVLMVAVVIGLQFFSETFFTYLIFVSTLSAVLMILTCISAIATDSKRKRIKMFGKL